MQDQNQNMEPESAHDADAAPAPAPAGAPAQQGDTAGQALSSALRLSFMFLQSAMGVLVAAYLASGLFRAAPSEVCVKTSFGKPMLYDGRAVLDSQSGWHMRWPWQKVIRIPVNSRVLVLDKEFWYRETRKLETGEAEAAQQTLSELHPALDGYLLTGDLNIIHTQWAITYAARIEEKAIRDFAFGYAGRKGYSEENILVNTDGVEDILRLLAEDSIIRCASGVDVDFTLVGSQEGNLMDIVARDLAENIRDFEEKAGISLGIEISQVTHTKLVVPASVAGAFDMVKNMQTQYQTAIRKAQSDAAKLAIEAIGEAQAIISSSEAEKQELIRSAKGDAEKMSVLLDEYRRNPAIFTQWHYQSAVEDLLSSSKEIYLLHEADEGARREVRVLVSPIPKAIERQQKMQDQQARQGASGEEGATE
ncbi:MAG TPA: SPFH domain-containing protein [Candidatus Brocadiia bacterium]|nr:SPFH domain-containing protein [Candidatus Brocadiia bacterium]